MIHNFAISSDWIGNDVVVWCKCKDCDYQELRMVYKNEC